jgi:hypothetical protein
MASSRAKFILHSKIDINEIEREDVEGIQVAQYRVFFECGTESWGTTRGKGFLQLSPYHEDRLGCDVMSIGKLLPTVFRPS